MKTCSLAQSQTFLESIVGGDIKILLDSAKNQIDAVKKNVALRLSALS